jgi:hypothetical protein
MLGVRVEWAPPDGLFSQTLYRGDDVIAHLLAAAFVYDDAGGEDTSVYRVKGFDIEGALLYDSGPFQMPVNRAAVLRTRTRLDHDTGARDAFRYVEAGGQGLDSLEIRVYTEVDWQQGRRDSPIAISQTGPDGRWLWPVFLEPGFTYVVHAQKNGRGPVTTNVTL